MKQIITMKVKYLSGMLFLFFFSIPANAQLLGWDANSNGGGFGASPWTPATQNVNISTSGLVRGASILTSGTPAGGAWGGSGGWSTGSGATTDNNSFHFTVVANTGYKVSLSSITTATRRSNSGPSGYTLYYSVNGGTFTSAGTATTTSTSGTTGTPNTISLSGISALQDVPAGTVIKFRINPSGTGGNYYVTGGTNSVRVNGTVQAAIPDAPVATDATNVLTNEFTANWNAVVGASGYRIDIATDAAFTNILENYDNFAVAGTSLNVNMDVLPNITYYYRVRAEQGAVVSNNSNIIEVTTECNPVVQPTAQPQTLCNMATVLQLSATGTGVIKWYSAETGGTALPDDTLLASATYYASQTIDGCESERVAVEIVITPIPAAPVAENQLFCGEATVSMLQVVTAEAPLWYNAETGGTALTAETVLATGTYYVSQTVNGCESSRIAVQVTVNPIPAAPVAQAQLFCGEGTVAGLQVTTGQAPLWYSAETGGTALTVDTMLSTGTYYVSQTINGCESPRTAVLVTVNPVPVLPTGEAQLFCSEGTVAELQVTTGDAPLWYDVETGGTALTADTQLATGTYYVSQTINGCESARTAVQITINPIPAAPVVQQTVQTFCNEATLANINTDGESVLWYTSPVGGTALAGNMAIVEGTSIYYASQTVNGCESTGRTAVAVVLNITGAPVVEAQDFCDTATVADLEAGTQNVLWYNVATGGVALAVDVPLATGTYYASQITNGCESAERTAVAVTVNTIPALPTAEAQTFCGGGTVGELEVTSGENTQWYTAMTGGTPLAANTVLATGNYYVSQTVNGCESERAEVMVIVNTVPGAPVVQNSVVTVCNNAVVADLDAEGENVLWYTTSSGGMALAEDAILNPGISIYYASQTINGCESVARTAVAVVFNTTNAPVAPAQSFCNEATALQLEADGENISWYSEETGGTALTGDEALTTGNYYVSQTINGCESPRTEVAVTVTVVAGPAGEATQEFVSGETLADLDVTGENLIWYADQTLTQILDETTVLADGTTYYAVATMGGCTSEAFTVTVDEVLSNEDFVLQHVNYFPNPVKDILTVSYIQTISSITVFNIVGQSIIEKSVNADKVSIDMSGLAPGTYVVRIVAADKAKTIKIIKQ